MTEEKKPDKPKPGTMQIKGGKMSMYLDGAWQDFGVAYVAKDMRKIARPVNGRKHGYAPILKAWAAELESQGLFALSSIQGKLTAFYGAREKWMAQDCRIWAGWLKQIYQFRNCTGKKDKPVHVEADKNFRDNFEKSFAPAPIEEIISKAVESAASVINACDDETLSVSRSEDTLLITSDKGSVLFDKSEEELTIKTLQPEAANG